MADGGPHQRMNLKPHDGHTLKYGSVLSPQLGHIVGIGCSVGVGPYGLGE